MNPEKLKNYSSCSLIKEGIKAGIGKAEVIDGKCEGYVDGHGEPLEKCKSCIDYIYYQFEEVQNV